MLAKIETMCKHCDKLTNKVANLEAVGSTPIEASKKKSSIFDMPKKDASCLYFLQWFMFRLILVQPSLCWENCCRYMHTRGCNGEWATQVRSDSPYQWLDSSKRQNGASPTSSR